MRRIFYSVRMRAGRQSRHISGAEGIFSGKDEISQAARLYVERALSHPKGRPEAVSLKVELLDKKPLIITSLPVSTLEVNGMEDSRRKAAEMLLWLGISQRAVKTAFD